MEKVCFTNSRGLELIGNYWESESDMAIIMCHGFTGDKNEWGYFSTVAENINRSGYNVLAFDFSGSGESEDCLINVANEVDDLSCAIEYMNKINHIERIGLYGHSLGGLVSLKNESPKISAIVLTSPVTSGMEDYGEHRFENDDTYTSKDGYFVKHREKGVRETIKIDKQIVEERKGVNQNDLLSDTQTPILIIHGDKDSVVPLEDSRQAAEKFRNVELEVISGLSHDYDMKHEDISNLAVDWFNKHM